MNPIMNPITKKIIACLVLNQILKAIPDIKKRVADATGQDANAFDTEILPDKIPVTAVAVIWQALSKVVDWRVLLALAVGGIFLYYLSKRMDTETELLSDRQIYDVSRNLLAQ